MPLDGSHVHDSNHGQKSWDTVAFLRRFPMHTALELGRTFSDFWGETVLHIYG